MEARLAEFFGRLDTSTIFNYSTTTFTGPSQRQARSHGGGAIGAYAPSPPRQAKMVRVVEYLIITVSPQERLSPPTVEHSL